MPNGPDHADIRRSYDLLAERYSAQLGDELVYKPLDRALLGALIEQHLAGTSFVDLGCGPGHVAAWLTWTEGAQVPGFRRAGNEWALERLAGRGAVASTQ